MSLLKAEQALVEVLTMNALGFHMLLERTATFTLSWKPTRPSPTALVFASGDCSSEVRGGPSLGSTTDFLLRCRTGVSWLYIERVEFGREVRGAALLCSLRPSKTRTSLYHSRFLERVSQRGWTPTACVYEKAVSTLGHV